MTFTIKNPRNWHRWFAWYPVRVYLSDTKPFSFSEEDPPKTYHWLCWVERRSRGASAVLGAHRAALDRREFAAGSAGLSGGFALAHAVFPLMWYSK